MNNLIEGTFHTTVIIVGNKISDSSSIPGQDCLGFTLH